MDFIQMNRRVRLKEIWFLFHRVHRETGKKLAVKENQHACLNQQQIQEWP